MNDEMDEKERLLINMKKLREKINNVFGKNAIHNCIKEKKINDYDDIDKMLKKK